MDPSSLEFLAEDELIEINPKVNIPKLKFLCGAFGPFVPGRQMEVPIWLAISLRKSLLCSIIPPRWLTVAYLRDWLRMESERQGEYSSPPSFYYLEIAHVLLSHALEDIPDAELLRRLLFSIKEIRRKKTMSSFQDIHNDGEIIPGRMAHFEYNQVRPLLAKSLKFVQSAKNLTF